MQENIQVSYFKTNLKSLMLKKSVEVDKALNRSDVAKATGLSIPTVSRWYEGRVDRLESETIERLKSFFNCEFDDLVEYVDE